jgi:two-component system sensor histidine kinase DctS
MAHSIQTRAVIPAVLDPRNNPPRPAPAAAWWALPFLLSLVFVIAVAAWLDWSDRAEHDDAVRVQISDALSLESQLSGRIEAERNQLLVLASKVHPGWSAARFASMPEVTDGLRRFWVSITWIDANNRLIAHLPEHAEHPERTLRAGGADSSGISTHLSATLRGPDGREFGRLVARFAPAAVLRTSVPWWLARKYEVRMIDGSDQVLAATSELPMPEANPSHRISMEPALPDTYLELISRTRLVPWWRTLPMALMLVFLGLVSVATGLLRRQMRQIADAEQRWRTEAAWRSAMEDSALVALRARDAEGRLLYVNRTLCDMVGLPAEQLIGRLPPMPYWPPDSIEDAMMRSRRNLAGLAPRDGYEARWLRSDGQMLDVMVFESPLVDAAGQQIGWMGSIIDITQRKRLEDNERRQNEALAHQARLTTLGEIASALAHELNQPLTAITGYNAGVLRSLQQSGYDNRPVLQALQRLGEQASHAGRVVQRIREFLTRRGPQPEATGLAEITRHAVSLIQRDLKRQQIRLDWQLDPADPAVLADPVLVEQVVINLVRNASDELVAQRPPEQRQIRISSQVAGTFLRLQIEDSGRGLGECSIEKLCSPFYSTKAEGMGMGLAICRSIIEAHHGALDCGASALGGASLAFTLPLAAAAQADPAPPVPTP